MTTPPASGEAQPSGGWTPQDDASGHRRPRWARVVRWTAAIVGGLALLVVAAGVADYFYLNSKITTQPVVLPSGASNPAKIATKAENFVLIGSDTRAGANGKGTGGSNVQGARSDTTMILHISANDGGATIISIPRDSWVQIPSCVVKPDGTTSAPEMNKFNAAFSIGGEYYPRYAASCTVHTIETLTGLHIDHYAVVDFVGFEHMVEALGGVRMCVAVPLKDPIFYSAVSGTNVGTGLDLPAGKSVEINGQQALDLMRARESLDGGGDLPRIKRQQEFVAAMIRKATSTSLLINPIKLQRFLSAAASSLTTDGFGLGTMRQLASALHSVGAGGVHLLTVPNLTDQPGIPYGDVEWDPTKAPELWNDLRHDTPLPGTTPTPTATPTPTPTPSGPALSVPPSAISVAVQNGTATAGLAAKAAQELTQEGFNVVSVGDAGAETYTHSVVEYGPEKVQSSQTVAAAIPGAKRVADSSAGTTVTVILGSDFTAVQPVAVSGSTSSAPTPSPTFSAISAARPGCLS